MRPRSKNLLDKAIDALIAGIEIYNKPVFSYREETFSILAINAWELLIKSRILQLSNNKMASILEYEKRKKSNGEFSEKAYRKRSRSGNIQTISLFKGLERLNSEYGTPVDQPIKNNLEALAEIRDNSVHLTNKDLTFSHLFHEISSANVFNFVTAVRLWFGRDLSEQRMFLMPLAFISAPSTVPGLSMNNEEQHLARYLNEVKSRNKKNDGDFSVALTVEILMKRTKDNTGAAFSVTKDPSAISIRLEESDILDAYPWEYRTLTTRLQHRYEDFKQNNEFHKFRKTLEDDSRFCKERLLDPKKPDGTKKKFYNPNIIKEFDNKYTRRQPTVV